MLHATETYGTVEIQPHTFLNFEMDASAERLELVKHKLFACV